MSERLRWRSRQAGERHVHDAARQTVRSHSLALHTDLLAQPIIANDLNHSEKGFTNCYNSSAGCN